MITITIKAENWKHLSEKEAINFLVNQLAKDNEAGLITSTKPTAANFYKENGIEYAVFVKNE